LESTKGHISDGEISSSEPERPEITDLVFVVHGIGQKLSQRYEGYSFTHAITSLRQSINGDLRNPTIQKGLRDNFGGIAVLPINWRQGFNFGDGGALLPGHKLHSASSSKMFGLHDITPHSIPMVRSLISDVLLDIPFYMSSHKSQMTEAVVKEANRIYRLWCQNNPSFREKGRVHVIGHSLGSALCLDILSQQPTFVSPSNITDKQLTTKHFEFDTTNLFLVGSPVGFFLLLGSSKLLPRHGRKKPGSIIDDEKTKDLTGNEGTYGCMAVDNLYNIMHYDDPIAYRVNAAVDVEHAASLKKAEVPSATTASWWDTLQSITQSVPPLMPSFSTATTKATPIKVDTVESESPPPPSVEPYQDEEVLNDAELRFHLLNDNGQIDYFLKAAEGPEIQYLNMLWAHGSYWSNLDFVRLLVMELGREPGREFALGAMRAVKKT
jgi:pimeloyl-ACP methyl ester carboxylesterase